jgi:hypothetical protein
MNESNLSRRRAALEGSAVALTIALLAFGVTAALLGLKGGDLTIVGRPLLGSGRKVALGNLHFGITGAVSASDARIEPALLEPGESRFLWYTVHNRATVPLTVDSLRIKSVHAPKACGAPYLDISQTTFTKTFVVPGRQDGVDGTASVAVPLSLQNRAAQVPACAGSTFAFAFAGAAFLGADGCTAPAGNKPRGSTGCKQGGP